MMGAKYHKVENNKEWICDVCNKCGDPKCCKGKRIMYQLGKTDKSKCSQCLRKK